MAALLSLSILQPDLPTAAEFTHYLYQLSLCLLLSYFCLPETSCLVAVSTSHLGAVLISLCLSVEYHFQYTLSITGQLYQPTNDRTAGKLMQMDSPYLEVGCVAVMSLPLRIDGLVCSAFCLVSEKS